MTMRPVKGIIPKPHVVDARPRCCVENTGNGVGVLLRFKCFVVRHKLVEAAPEKRGLHANAVGIGL